MNSDAGKFRHLMLILLAATRQKTGLSFSVADPGKIVIHDVPSWSVRDVLGHLGVWNGEAARSLRAHAEGSEYHCIESEAEYDEYNRTAVEERRPWTIDRVWSEYETSCDQLKLIVESMPDAMWDIDMLYPWNERGSVRKLIEIMMKHEDEHREVISTDEA